MSEKRTKRSYTKEFKKDAVGLALKEARTQADVSRSLGIDQPLLGRWILQEKADGTAAFPGRGKLKPQDQKVHDLEKELRRVTMERDILKKAMAYFAEIPK